MRILIHTRFYPNIGGIETVVWLLAHEWVKLGLEIIVASDVECPPEKRREFPFPVFYRPSPIRWLKLMRWCDVYLQFNVSLKSLWPRLLVRRPMVFSHHGWYWITLKGGTREGGRDWRERLKLHLAAKAMNIFASQAIARVVGVSGEVIPDPYDDTLFRQRGANSAEHGEENGKRELAFVGRLVSDKGADLLLQALALVWKNGEGSLPKGPADRQVSPTSGDRQDACPTLTIIGDGPERPALEQLTKNLKLEGQVFFAGAQPQEKVAELLRCHEILVVPSLWQEPFGVVTLEGAACGCVVLGSDGGGLPEAIGPAGITFKRGDVNDLALKLSWLLQHPGEWSRYREAAPAHLAKHEARAVAERYLKVFEKHILKR